jgi:hypothetical protein
MLASGRLARMIRMDQSDPESGFQGGRSAVRDFPPADAFASFAAAPTSENIEDVKRR